MNHPNPTEMKPLVPGVYLCRDDDAIKRKLKAAGLWAPVSESIRTCAGKDLLLLHQDEQGAHAFVYHSNPRDSGFTHYQADNPAMLLSLMACFAQQCGGGGGGRVIDRR